MKLPTSHKQSQNLLRSISFELTYLEEIPSAGAWAVSDLFKADEASYQDGIIAVWTFLESYPLSPRELDNLSKAQRDRIQVFTTALLVPRVIFYSKWGYQRILISEVISSRNSSNPDFLLGLSAKSLLLFKRKISLRWPIIQIWLWKMPSKLIIMSHPRSVAFEREALITWWLGMRQAARRICIAPLICFSLANSSRPEPYKNFKLRLACLAEIRQVRAFQVAVTHLEEVVGGRDQAVDSVRVVLILILGSPIVEGDLIQARRCLTELRRFCHVRSLGRKNCLILPILDSLSARGSTREKVAAYLSKLRKERTMIHLPIHGIRGWFIIY